MHTMTLLLLTLLGIPTGDESLSTGHWRAWLDSPGGELPFGIELRSTEQKLRASLLNGPERIPVPEVFWEEDELVFDIGHYDSEIRCKLTSPGHLQGTWKKRLSDEDWAELPFHATAGRAPRFSPAGPPSSLDGRWSVQFSSSEDPAVALFETRNQELLGTFLTTTGDYRFLAGSMEGDRLRLSCFDGAHAFLFEARRREDGSLEGDFWSRDRWHETWTARPDATAELPDPFQQTTWTGALSLEELVFPDLDGRPRSLNDPEFQGKARLLYVFGSWCPNCHDATETLAELQGRYGPRGLSIVGLAFELTDDESRNAEVVRRYARRHDISWPLLLAGPANKAEATKAFPVLDRVRSYPTTLFLEEDGTVRAIHTGFSGPATGEAHERLKRRFVTLIEELLDPSGDS